MKIYNVWNKTTSIFFEDKKDAEKFASSHGITCGLNVAEIQVLPSSKEPSNTRMQRKPGKTEYLYCSKCDSMLCQLEGHKEFRLR